MCDSKRLWKWPAYLEATTHGCTNIFIYSGGSSANGEPLLCSRGYESERGFLLCHAPGEAMGNGFFEGAWGVMFRAKRDFLKKGHAVQKPGFCVSKIPVFAQPARRLGALLSDFRVLDTQIRRFPMARTRLITFFLLPPPRFGAYFFSWGRGKFTKKKSALL